MENQDLVARTKHISDIFANVMASTTMQAIRSACGGYKVSLAQFRALSFVSRNSPCSVGKLAEGLGISQPAATMMVDRLVHKGLIRRETGGDRRLSLLRPTNQAQDVLAKAEIERGRHFANLLARLKPEQRIELMNSLRQAVLAALKDHSPDNVCLRCGSDHIADCIVDQARRKS